MKRRHVVMLLALLAMELGHGVRARALRSHDTGSGQQDGPAVSPPWDAFTKFENTWILAPRLLSSDTAVTGDECAARCNDNRRCTHWTWCPPFTGAGCDVLVFGDLTSDETQGPTTCLLSYDPVPDRTANLIVDGPSVAWMGGFYFGGPSSSPPSDPSSPPSNPSSSPDPDPTPEPEPAPTPEPSSPSLDPPAVEFCNVLANTLYAPTGKDAEVVGTFDDVASEGDCCDRCFADDDCTAWFMCYGDADSCTEWEYRGRKYSNDGKDIQPGTCILWKIPNLDEATLVSDNPATPWASGILSDAAMVVRELRNSS